MWIGDFSCFAGSQSFKDLESRIFVVGADFTILSVFVDICTMAYRCLQNCMNKIGQEPMEKNKSDRKKKRRRWDLKDDLRDGVAWMIGPNPKVAPRTALLLNEEDMHY